MADRVTLHPVVITVYEEYASSHEIRDALNLAFLLLLHFVRSKSIGFSFDIDLLGIEKSLMVLLGLPKFEAFGPQTNMPAR